MPQVQTELRTLLTSYLNSHPGTESQIADEFQVAVSTVRRWANGVAQPHPRLAQIIIDYVKKLQAG